MALMTWDSTLLVGVAEIDGQHKKLVEIVNTMHDGLSVGKAKEILGKVLDELVAYTVSHFSTEERIMTAQKYEGYEKHKAEHTKLIEDVSDFVQKFKAGKSMISIELMNFLKDWLSKHILETDKKLGAALNAKGIH